MINLVYVWLPGRLFYPYLIMTINPANGSVFYRLLYP
jgi:hypothetical protein